MICPHCHKDIPDTAIRCKYCRAPVHEEEHHELGVLLEKETAIFKRVLVKGKGTSSFSCRIVDTLIIAALIIFFALNDPFHIAENIIKFLRLHFSVFTRDPRLLYYTSTYLNMAIIKLASLAFIVIIVRMRGVPFWRTVVFSGKVPALWWRRMPLYGCLCLVLCWINMMDPLVPNLPFNSVFIGSKVIGNIIVVFSALFIAPLVEEVLFRGFFYPSFNRYMGMYPAMILTSILFTFAHYPQGGGSGSYLAGVFLLSMIMSYARARTDSTWVAIVMHHIYNLACIIMGLLSYLVVRY